ncbi:MAG: LysR family transcriptional regulator [Oscillospiraceae bacterium]|nr:LysR family transcriptional regulator [Oscillospiraceae bacterium]
MKTSRYEIFLKIVETQSLTRTAAYFGCTQSAVSQLVRAMETDLGVALLVRSKGGVRLTAEGEYLLPSMRQIVNGERSVFEKSLELQNMNAGLIRIGIFTSLSCQWLPPHLKRFRATYPNIDFELLQGDTVQICDWLRNGMVDIGFMTKPESEEFVFQELMEDRMNIVLPMEHPLAGEKIHLSDLKDETFVLLESGYSQITDKMLQDAGVRPKRQYTVKDDYTVMSMVESGLGVSLLPELMLQRTPYKLYIQPSDPPYYRRLGVSWLRKEQNSVAVNKFVQRLLADMGLKSGEA